MASVRSSMYKSLVFERYMAEPVFQRLLECNTQGLDRHLWQQLLLDAINQGIQDSKLDADGCRSEQPPCWQLSANNPPESELGTQSPVNQPGLIPSAGESSIDDTLDMEFQKMRTINLRAIQAQVAKCRFLQNFIRSGWSDWLRNGNAVSDSVGASQLALLNWAELWEVRFKQLQQEESACESDSPVDKFGSHEQLAMEFLKNCQSGLVEPVRTQLRTDFTSQASLRPTVDPNVADHHGCFGLFYAVLAWNETLVNVLLDFGANVNQMTDEGVTALGLAFLFYSRAMQQLADQAGSQAKHHLIRVHAPESESELYSESKMHDDSTFLHQAEVTIYLKDLAIVDDEKQRELAKLAQMHKLYAQKSSTKAATALKPITEGQWAKDREQSSTAEQPEMKLPSFERFTECLTRLNKQLDLRESARQRVQEMKDAVMQEETPHSKHPLIEWPTKEASAGAISAVARGLSRNTFFLAKQSLTPSSLSREGTMDTQTSSDSVGEFQSAVNQKAFLLVQKNQIVHMIGLLLQRGADPNMATQPIPSLFLAVRWGDISMVKRLLCHGAQVNAALEVDRDKCVEQSVCEVSDFTEESAQPHTSPVLSLDGLTPLHYAVLLSGKKGVRMVQILLEAGANPDAQAAPDQSFTIQSSNQESENTVGMPTEGSPSEGGRTPLHLACAREYGHENAAAMVQAMMDHGANPNLTCNGHTALTLAIASGNDFAIDILLRYPRTNVNLKLTNGLGSALAVAAARMFEYRRDGETRLKLLKKLVEVGGASTIMRFPMSWMSCLGNVVDATYNNYQEDLRLTKVPYHALHAVEKEVYTSRANIMEYLAGCLRTSLYAAGHPGRSEDLTKEERRSRSPAKGTCRHQGFLHVREDSKSADSKLPEQDDDFYPFCYGCGRSLGVRLTPCAKCKRVYYCSKACRMKRTQPPPKKKRPVSVKPKVLPPVEHRPVRKPTTKAKTGKRQVLVCRSGGGEFLSLWHPAREFQFIINRYLRVNQRGRIFINCYDGHGNYSLE
ncbi:ankyrin repeat and MYND domain-containing protein 1 [Clonorchis sinensis]|uniref:Ankyrin repeat and MYND domain-containing protein 1 n=1 Tax=Clonorchis sinensis TaxID=79923 RepID=G7YHF1_CLOSI|nr:ankyrin repeat and MYND domain-containing protein 1 [Clonorchis sinensis]